MSRKSIPEKIKKKIFQETGMICPMCGETDVSTFEIHHIQPLSEGNDHDEDNLIMLCSNCHSKVTAGDYSATEILKLKLALVRGKHPYTHRTQASNVVNLSNSVNTGIIANKIEITSKKKTVKMNAPAGTIGANLNHRNYAKRLIDRYHEFKRAEVGKENMNYTILYGSIQKAFGAKWDLLPLDKFDALCRYLQTRIDKTILGKNKKVQGVKRYSTFSEYLEKYCT